MGCVQLTQKDSGLEAVGVCITQMESGLKFVCLLGCEE